MVVVSKSSDLNHVEVKSETEPSANSSQDVPVDQVELGIVLLESKVQKIQQIIHEWKDPSPSEVQQQAEEELLQLLALVHKLIHEGPESFLPRINTNCSNAIRKCPKAPPILMFGRKNVFLKNIAQWAWSTHSVLSEKEQQYKSLMSSRSARIKCEETTIQLVNEVKTLEKSHADLLFYGRFYNIHHKAREYLTVPRPFYGLSEEPMGEHVMAKVEVKMGNPQERVKLQVTKTVHSYWGASTESPPEVWLNQIRQHRDSPGQVHVAQLLGYNRCGRRYDLIFHGSLVPFEEQLRKLYITQPLNRVELISKTTWELNSVRSFLVDQLKFTSSHPAQLYWFLIPMLHFNEEKNKMVICGDLSQWQMEGNDILARSRDAAKLRLPVMFKTSALAGSDIGRAPLYPDFSRAPDLYPNLSNEQQRHLVLGFYEALVRTFTSTGNLSIPFFMRGIHVDPRIHKPCNGSWCRPMVDIWDDSVTCFIEKPEACRGRLPLYNPGGPISSDLLKELPDMHLPRYLQIWTSHPPHCQGSRMDLMPLSLIRSSLIWFSQAGRVFSSPQFKKSGLKKSDIMYIRTRALRTAWMMDPPSDAAVPDDLSLELSSFSPHMDMNGIHLGPTKWTTDNPLHRYEICESSWTIRKCFYCTAAGFSWDDAAYKALDDFHCSLGVDPSSGEMVKFLGYPLLDIDDLLHMEGWMCSHPTIQDSVTTHTLTSKDFDINWDPSIRCPSPMVKDGTSEINLKMQKSFDEGYGFSRNDLDYVPPPLYARRAACWVIILVQVLFTCIFGWPA